MDILTKIAEQRIQEAINNGYFNNLPNSGRLLRLHEDGLIPAELRIAYKVLKNAGFIPPELELRKEIISLRSLIDTIDDNKERIKKLRELNFKLLRLNESLGRDLDLDNFPVYGSKIWENSLNGRKRY